jgi:SAM-dependent methyltransferase
MVGSRFYDLAYRWGWAPWDAVGVRSELLTLLAAGEVTPATHPRAIDLGCGTGANVVELAGRGFETTGVDFSVVALRKAEARAHAAGVVERCRFVEVDLTAASLPPAVGAGYDLLLDFGTLDDLRPEGRARMAAHVARLARPGAVVLLWCFYGARQELPRISFQGPSRLTPGLEPGEEEQLFGEDFEIADFARPHPHAACFLLHRRARSRSASGERSASKRPAGSSGEGPRKREVGK